MPKRIFNLSIKDLEIKNEFNSFLNFIYAHKNPFEPQEPDHLEKLAESHLFNFHHKLILLKLKIKSYSQNLVLKTLQLELSC